MLRVNNKTLQVADVIQSLDGHLRVGDLAQHLVDGGSQFIQILSVAAAAWNPQTREDVELLLFHRWLAERRRQSRVTWFWGERDQGEREGTA